MARLAMLPALLCAWLALPGPARADVAHPLDPLAWDDYWAVLDTLQSAGKLDGGVRFSQVRLVEPGKDAVLAWQPGDPIPERRAYAALRSAEGAFEAMINLASGKLERWEPVADAHLAFTPDEFLAGVDQALADPAFLAALAARGYDDPSLLDCLTFPPGYFGTQAEQSRRIGHLRCTDPSGVRNTWPRELAGLTAVVDVDSGEVLEVTDEGVTPLPPGDADFDPASLGAPRAVPGPLHISQPEGPGFSRDGQVIHWQNWSFHVRMDQREGPVLSMVRYRDGDETRSVLYQGHLSEIFVPYMDPSFAWHARNFIDLGEYVMGGLFMPLLRGRDCPGHAHYLDSLQADAHGRPQEQRDTLCLFERDAGDPAWRHVEPGSTASRPRRDLVLRAAAVIGNYDYLFDWVFRQDGSITVAVGATGIVEAKAARGADASAGTGEDAYGRYVAPHILGINHDHYFSFRLDFDVDGTDNAVTVDRLVQKRLDSERRKSIWVREPSLPATESEAMMNINLKRPALWRVTSAARKNRNGYPTSYRLKPGGNAEHLLTDDDYAHRRAGFIDHHLWVTPFDPEERYAAGEHPTLSEPGLGLPAWTAADRPIRDRDIVLWYTMGMHHLVRAEDWPVMPVLWHSFELRPFDFFDENPAMDLPAAR